MYKEGLEKNAVQIFHLSQKASTSRTENNDKE